MLGFKFPQSLLLRKTFLVERLTHPARGFGQRIFYFRSSHHYPNGFRQVAAGAARIGILTSEGEIQRIGPEQTSSYIIQLTLPQYGKMGRATCRESVCRYVER